MEIDVALKIEHWKMECEGLRLDSSGGCRIFLFVPHLWQDKNIFLYKLYCFIIIVLFYIMMMYISTVQHPLLSLVEIVHKGGGWDERDRRLILWYFEEQLKQRYQEFVEVVEVFVNQWFPLKIVYWYHPKKNYIHNCSQMS